MTPPKRTRSPELCPPTPRKRQNREQLVDDEWDGRAVLDGVMRFLCSPVDDPGTAGEGCIPPHPLSRHSDRYTLPGLPDSGSLSVRSIDHTIIISDEGWPTLAFSYSGPAFAVGAITAEGIALCSLTINGATRKTDRRIQPSLEMIVDAQDTGTPTQLAAVRASRVELDTALKLKSTGAPLKSIVLGTAHRLFRELFPRHIRPHLFVAADQ